MTPIVVIALAMTSCSPYPFDLPVPPVQQPQEEAITKTDKKVANPVTYKSQKAAARDQIKATQRTVKKAASKPTLPPKPQYKKTAGESSLPKPQAIKKAYKTGTKVAGKAGFIYSPHSGNKVDVRGLASGTKVRDPLDSDKSHIFLVP